MQACVQLGPHFIDVCMDRVREQLKGEDEIDKAIEAVVSAVVNHTRTTVQNELIGIAKSAYADAYGVEYRKVKQTLLLSIQELAKKNFLEVIDKVTERIETDKGVDSL